MTKEGSSGLRTYFQDGVSWEAEIVRKAQRARALAWFVASIFGAVTLMTLKALLLLVPLKSFEPYIVEVDRNTGYVEVKSGLTRPSNLTEEEAVTQASIVRYIRAREGYDPYRIEENFGIATLLSTGAAARELQALHSAGSPDNPARLYGTGKEVLVDVKSVAFPNESTALVRFSTDERGTTDTVSYLTGSGIAPAQGTAGNGQSAGDLARTAIVKTTSDMAREAFSENLKIPPRSAFRRASGSSSMCARTSISPPSTKTR